MFLGLVKFSSHSAWVVAINDIKISSLGLVGLWELDSGTEHLQCMGFIQNPSTNE